MEYFLNQINWYGFVVYEIELYIVGGERNGMVLKVFEKFDLEINRWESMFLMLKEVLFLVVVFLGKCFYVIGVSRGYRGIL